MTTFSIETYTDNFTVKRDFTFSNLLSVGGWHTFSPLENAKCAKLGITDPKKDIVTKDNVYVFPWKISICVIWIDILKAFTAGSTGAESWQIR